MKRLLIMAMLCTMAMVPAAQAQTVVNLSVVDTPDSQSWNAGSWAVKLIPGPGNLSQTGSFTLLVLGGSLASQTGSLSGTGTAAITLPANANIGPAGTVWQFTVCPQASAGCFQQSVAVSTSTPQTLTLTPPSIRINLATATPPVSAYSTGEISAAVLGSQFLLIGSGQQFCTAVSGTTCTTFSGSVATNVNNAFTGTQSFTNLTASGTVKLAQVNGVCAVDGVTNTTLAAAVTCAGTNGVVDVPMFAVPTLTAGVTIPAGVTLMFEGGSPGLIQLGNFNLTINGPFVAPQAQVFSYTGTGTVSFAPPPLPVCACWFSGADSEAKINNAYASLPAVGGGTETVPASMATSSSTGIVFNGPPVHLIFDAGVWTHTGTNPFLTAGTTTTVNGIVVEGVNGAFPTSPTQGTVFKITGTTTNGLTLGSVTSPSPCPVAPCQVLGSTFRQFQIIGPGSGSGIGIFSASLNATLFEEIRIQGMGGDGQRCDASTTGDCVKVTWRQVHWSGNGGNGLSLNPSAGTNLAAQNVIDNTQSDTNTGDCYHFGAGGQNVIHNAYASACTSSIGFNMLNSSQNVGSVYCDSNGSGLNTCLKFDSSSIGNDINMLGGGNLFGVNDAGVENSWILRGYRHSGTILRLNSTTGFTSATKMFDFSQFPGTNPAQVWALDCKIKWQVTAGTAPTFSIGINVASNANSVSLGGTIYETNATNGAPTMAQGFVDNATNGNQAVVTTGALTPSGTEFQAVLWGVIQLNTGAANTIVDVAVTATGTGAGFSGSFLPGSVCKLE